MGMQVKQNLRMELLKGPDTLRSLHPATVLMLEGKDVDACVAYPHLKENKRRAGR